MKRLLLVGIVVLIAGCAGSPAWESMQISATRAEAERNNTNLLKVQIGHTKDEFLSVMGPPAKREAYQVGNRKTVEFLFYRTTGWSSMYTTDMDAQFTPVAIEEGKVVGWGRNYYDRVVRAAVEMTIK